MDMEYPEGATPLDPDEMDGLKYPHIQTRSELDQLEQQNIQDGYNWLARQRKYKDFLREDFILQMHKQFFGSVWKWAGHYRHSEKNIGIDHLHIGVALRDLLDDARYWIKHNTYSREEFAARFHHRLVVIHPVPNGNGRHARILTDVILEKVLHVLAVNWGAGDLVADSDHRHAYIAALRAADGGDYQSLIAFISR